MMMLNYLLLIISAAFFLIGFRFYGRVQHKTKTQRIIFSLVVTCFVIWSFIFVASDFITGNGVDYSISYFILDSLFGIGFLKGLLYAILISIVLIAVFAGSYFFINKMGSRTESDQGKAGRNRFIFVMCMAISFLSSPTTFGFVNNFYLSENTETRLQEKAQENRYEVDRFIAHAGGEINGYTYTNTLEALNLSYKNGFRLFELDILSTSDSIYVAAHDWEGWQKMTGYAGQLPPSRAEFKQFKILEKYTPLDIDDINNWFLDHPDAILISDKINTPLAFSKAFIDKERLMMELFSLEAVKEGAKSKIKSAMASWGVLSEIKGDKVKALLDIGVTDIAVSRRIIKYNIPLLNSLKKNGIKVYVFHVNYDKGKDEDYVLCNDMDYIHGLYADKFDFQVRIQCD